MDSKAPLVPIDRRFFASCEAAMAVEIECSGSGLDCLYHVAKDNVNKRWNWELIGPLLYAIVRTSSCRLYGPRRYRKTLRAAIGEDVAR
jgi:hypothetical protein